MPDNIDDARARRAAAKARARARYPVTLADAKAATDELVEVERQCRDHVAGEAEVEEAAARERWAWEEWDDGQDGEAA